MLGVALGLLAACGGRTGTDTNERRGVPSVGGTSAGGVARGGAAGANGAAAGTRGSGGAAEDCVVDETLPNCAFTESCKDTYLECSVSTDCAIVFEAPVPLPSVIYVGCASISDSDWWFGETGRSIFLSVAACDAWRAAGEPRILVELVHSCLI